MSHSGSEKSAYRPKAVWAVLLLFALALLMLFTSGAAGWISDHILLPLGSLLGLTPRLDPRDALEAQDGIGPGPDEGERYILLPEQLQYYLQMGYYSDRTSADIQAKFIQSIGGAGYVYYDGGKYRVFAACYNDQVSAGKVQEQVRADGYESTSYILQTDAVKIRYAIPEDMDGNELSLTTLVCELGDEVLDIILEIDRQNLEKTEASAQLSGLTEKIDTLLNVIAEYPEFEPLNAYLGACKTALSTFEQISDTLSTAEYSAALKHVQIGICILYHETVMEL